MKEVRLFGCERSGTNYLTDLIRGNFDADVVCGPNLQKHEALDAAPTCPSVFVTKNPYSWLVSQHRYLDLKIGPIPKLGKCLGNEFMCSRRKRWDSMIDSYNRRVASWMEHCTLHVRYEGLLTEFVITMDTIRKGLGLAITKEYAEDIITEVGPMAYLHGSRCRANGPRSKWADRRYYINEEYLNEYSRGALKTVNGQLDWDLMGKLGYERKTMDDVVMVKQGMLWQRSPK